MRLVSDGEEQPMDVYVKYKDNIDLWYDEMKKAGLSKGEIKILEKHLLPDYGVSAEQESVMELTMDKDISSFSVKDANKLRKAIAKKKPKLLEEIKGKFYSQGKEIGTSKEMLDYVWNVQFSRQFGYSFSKNHTTPYSIICVQEMNLAHHHPRIFWNTACLTINAGADENNENNKTTNYGKIAKAIGELQSQGQKIALPDINKARFGFFPDTEKNEIIFSLKGISGIGDEIAAAIVERRPYNSFEHFLEKMRDYKAEGNKFGDSAVVALIKAGCFDELEKKPRVEIMKGFLKKLCTSTTSGRLALIEDLNSAGLLTDKQKSEELRFYRFREYIFNKRFIYEQRGKSPSTFFYELEERFAQPFFETHFLGGMEKEKDYYFSPEGHYVVKRGSIDKVFNELMSDFKTKFLGSAKIQEALSEYYLNTKLEEMAPGSISKWEMDTLSFYYHDHELENVDESKYSISDFTALPKEGIVAGWYKFRGTEKPRWLLTRIAGTVLDKDKNKHIVTILTKYGVVPVKFYKGQFTFYDKQISSIDEDGTKTVEEKSWFARGSKLLVTGYRRGDQFVPKKYNDSVFRHSLQLITNVEEDGNLSLRSERFGAEEEIF